MATLDDGFKQVLDDFKKRLKPEEQAKFAITTLVDLQKAASDIQEKQRRSKTAQNLTRIQPFLQAMTQYTEIIEVFLNTSSILCFVWGPMKFMLMTACNLNKAFDVLLDAYKQIAETFPLLLKYRSMFIKNEHMKKVLVWMYEDILKFHLRAWRVFSRPAWGKIFTSTWKDFQESFKPILNDLTRHRELIESTASLEQFQESRDARLKFQTEFAAREAEEKHKKKLHVIDWLAAADPESDQAAFSEARNSIPGSGKWILDQDQVKIWLVPTNNSYPMIWLSGKPGAGKTVLASVLIEACLETVQSAKDLSLAFFYCRDKDEQRNTFVSVAKAMLVQLLCQNPTILPFLYDECLKIAKPTLSTSEDCVKLLNTALQIVPQTLIILDGIDECEQKERSKVLKFFASNTLDSGQPGKVRCLFVSQELSDIKGALHVAHSIRLSKKDSEGDIRSFTVQWALKIQEHFNLPDRDKERIIELVCTGAEGMFLYARLVLQNLRDQESLEHVYKELHPDTFPGGFEQAYERIVNRIMRNPNMVRRRTAQKLLGWVAFSKRPLKWHEIQGATAIDLKNRNVDFQSRQMLLNIRDICGSLVELQSGDRVQLVHKTARDYLIKDKCLDLIEEETKLATLCMQYLTFDIFEPDIPTEAMLQAINRGDYAFLDYASLHWYHHLETAVISLTPDKLDDDTDLGAAINEFFEMYEPGQIQNEKVREEQLERCAAVKGADCYESLLLLLTYAKASRIAGDKMEALGTLGNTISKLRSVLEGLGKSPTSCPTQNAQNIDATRQDLEQFYGSKWYKCSRHACYYFHEGFMKERGLTEHTNRHEKPFCCTEMGCTRMYIGWSTEKELKQHMSQYHPDPEALSWKFPHVKKPPTKYQCKVCEKSYNRANSLSTHEKREHSGERPFKCKVCGKGFVRKYELDRHGSIHVGKSQESPLQMNGSAKPEGSRGESEKHDSSIR